MPLLAVLGAHLAALGMLLAALGRRQKHIHHHRPRISNCLDILNHPPKMQSKRLVLQVKMILHSLHLSDEILASQNKIAERSIRNKVHYRNASVTTLATFHVAFTRRRSWVLQCQKEIARILILSNGGHTGIQTLMLGSGILVATRVAVVSALKQVLVVRLQC